MNMVINLFQIIGALGLISIINGTFLLTKKSRKRKTIFTFLLIGGICLEIYSIYIQDLIFIILQSIYIIVTIYGWLKIK